VAFIDGYCSTAQGLLDWFEEDLGFAKIRLFRWICKSTSRASKKEARWQEITMGWLRRVGALKVQVAFAKEPYKRDDILQKRPIILRRLLIVATPYGVATTSRRLKIIGLFCRISSLL